MKMSTSEMILLYYQNNNPAWNIFIFAFAALAWFTFFLKAYEFNLPFYSNNNNKMKNNFRICCIAVQYEWRAIKLFF